MSLGHAPTQGDVLRSSRDFCHERLSPTSIYTLLHGESHRLFPDEDFADLFSGVGRWSVSPRVVAVVMVLQRLEGLKRPRGRGSLRLRLAVEVRCGRAGL